jgi:hypothetical protein
MPLIFDIADAEFSVHADYYADINGDDAAATADIAIFAIR